MLEMHFGTTTIWCSPLMTVTTIRGPAQATRITVQCTMVVDSGTNAAHLRVWTVSATVRRTSDGMWMEKLPTCNHPACGWCARSLRCLGWNWWPIKPERICFSCLSTINTGLIFSVVLTETMTAGGWYVLNLWQMTTRDVTLTVRTLTT